MKTGLYNTAKTIAVLIIMIVSMVSKTFAQGEFDSLFKKSKEITTGLTGSLEEKNKILQKEADSLLAEQKKQAHQKEQEELEYKDFNIQYEVLRATEKQLRKEATWLLDGIDTLAFDVELLTQGINSVVTAGGGKTPLDQKIKGQAKEFISLSKLILEKVMKIHATPNASPSDSSSLRESFKVSAFKTESYNNILTNLKVSNKLLEDHVIFLKKLKENMKGQVSDLQKFVDNQLSSYQSYFVSLKAQIRSGGKIKRPSSNSTK